MMHVLDIDKGGGSKYIIKAVKILPIQSKSKIKFKKIKN